MSYIIEENNFPDIINLAETLNLGPDTVAKLSSNLDFPFLEDRHGISLAGHTIARQGNLFIRKNPPFSQVLVCCSGEAVALINNRWVPLYPGMAYITPMHKRHAYFAKPSSHLEFSWVIYKDYGPKNISDHIHKDKAYTIQVDPNLLSYPLLGLYNESIHQKDEATMDSWARLVNTYVWRALSGKELDPRLRRLWISIKEDLSAKWTCESMAKIAGISEEHLRRLCHKVYSQSPMQRLTSLRIKYSEEFLVYSELSIEQIAEETGYSDAATLSRAFSRNKGIAPSKYRRQVRETNLLPTPRIKSEHQDWKMNEGELFRIEDDMSETHNVADEYPEVADFQNRGV